MSTLQHRATRCMVRRFIAVITTITFCPPAFAAPRAETRILRVTAGVGGLLREDCYAEVQVLAQHEGTQPLKARLEVACHRKGSGRIITTVERAVELPPHSRKRIELPLFAPSGTDSVEAALWVGGRRVARKMMEPSVLSSAVGTVLIVGEDNLNLTRDNPGRDGHGAVIFPLAEGGSPRYSPMPEVVRVGYVSDWTSLPSQATGYECVDTVILLSAPPRTFDAEQQRALTRWASEGGSLIVCAGGSPSAMQQSFLAPLLPVTLTTQIAMRDLRPLALLIDNPPIPQEKMLMVVVRVRKGAAIIAGDSQSPVAVKGAIGYFGTVVYLAFDPLREPFRSWDKRTEFWRGMLRWCKGNGHGPTFTGIKAEELNALIREAKVVNVPSRYVFLAPMVAYAVLMLVVTLYVIRFARRKEMTWLALSLLAGLFAVGYYFTLRRTLRGQLYLAGITTRYLLPNDPIEYQNASATFFTPTNHPIEVTAHAPGVRFSDSMGDEFAGWGNHAYRLDDDATHLRAVYPNVWSVSDFSAYREAPRKGGIEARLHQEGTTFNYHITNHTPYTLRSARVVVFHPDKLIVRSLPTLPPNASTRVTLSPTTGERWENSGTSLDELPSRRRKAQQQRRVRYWLTRKALEDSLFSYDERIYGGYYNRAATVTERLASGATLVAFTDQPPFPVAVRGLRQEWHHLLLAPLPGVHPDEVQRRRYNEPSGTDMESGQLLSHTARLEEDNEEGTTNVYRGEAVIELPLNYSESKGKRVVALSARVKPDGARSRDHAPSGSLECALFNFRTGRWTKWQPKFDRDGDARHEFDLDHVHPALSIAHLKLTVRSRSAKAFVPIRGLRVHVQPEEEPND